VVPVRNRPELLEQTLETLVAQDLPTSEFQIIICDDGSSDDIATVAERFRKGPVRVALERQPPLGPAAARNLGVRASIAQTVIFFDSDVLVEASAVRLLLNALDDHPEWRGAEAALHPVGEQDGILWDAPLSTSGGRFHTAAIAYRREVLFEVGGFDEQFTLPACEDVEIALRVLQLGPIGFVPQARVFHPRRRVTFLTHWRWRRHWRYETLLALRYGVLAFPGNPCGPFPRLRVAWSALVTLPAGRFLAATKSLGRAPKEAMIAAFLSLFDFVCGLAALPAILFQPVLERRDYLSAVVRDSREEVAV
jgi:GT2 family glycosyltransferase